MTKRLDILFLSVVCLLLAVTFGSCAQNEHGQSDEPDITSGRNISFKFRIYTDDVRPGTRTLGVWEEDAANVAERILDPNDMRVLLLNADDKLIRSVRPSVLEYNEGSSISGDGYYNLSVSFQDDAFDKYFDKNGENTPIDFRVMILANVNSIGGVYTTDAMLPGTPLEKLQEVFVMSRDWFPVPTKGIPMYGYKNSISARKSDLTSADGFDVGNIYLLRAMCKVEIIDDIVNAEVAEDGLKYPRVTGVEMISWRDKGNLVSADHRYESGLKTANIPDQTTAATTTPVQATYMDDDSNGTGVFRFYCPEAHLREVAFRVAAVLAPGEPERYYEVSLAQYADGDKANPEFGDDMVRNHIYRFNVNSVNTIADLTVTVADWGYKADEYTIDDMIGMAPDGFLTWTYDDPTAFSVSTVTYYGKEEQLLSMLNGTTDYATGTFHIESPRGAVWRAYFIPGDNGTDAFEFVDVDESGNVVEGSARSYVEGAVGSQAAIHIRGKGPADNYRHLAELVIEVHQPDGTIMYAPITTNNSTRYIIYRENKL